MIRWNPPLALEYMEHISGRVATMNSMIVRNYNKSVQEMNEYLDILERQRYYNKKEIWGQFAPRRLKEVEESLGDYSLYDKESQLS